MREPGRVRVRGEPPPGGGRTLGIVDVARSAAMESQLSGRELEVLSYMPTQLSAREIAETLHVSLNTVKSAHAERVPEARLRIA